MAAQVDYAEAVAQAMNVGLDSYLDVRLAMLLFRNVYTNEGFAYINHVASILLSALEGNPHNIEAWDLLFAHISLTTITDDRLIERAFEIFKPHASLYVKTYEKYLTAIATVYKCEASTSTGPLAFILSEIDAVAPGCNAAGTRIALKSSILPCYKTAYGVGIGTAKGYESTAVQLAWNECGDYSLSTRTNFALADMKAGAFAKLLTMLVGHAADQFDYGLAGNDHTATLAWLLELEQKIPVGHVSKMASSSCTEDKLSLGGDVWAVWGRTGRVLERKSHKKLRGFIKKYYSILGRVEEIAILQYDTFAKLGDPVQLYNDKRLTWGKAKSLGWFQECTCAKNNLYSLNWACCASTTCDVSRRRLLRTEQRHRRRLEITTANDVDSTTLAEMEEDAETGWGVEGTSGTLASQTQVTTEDYAILGEQTSSYSYDPVMFVMYEKNVSGSGSGSGVATPTTTSAPTAVKAGDKEDKGGFDPLIAILISIIVLGFLGAMAFRFGMCPVKPRAHVDLEKVGQPKEVEMSSGHAVAMAEKNETSVPSTTPATAAATTAPSVAAKPSAQRPGSGEDVELGKWESEMGRGDNTERQIKTGVAFL